MRRIRSALLVAALVLFLAPAASARCHTHRCWSDVHVSRLTRMVEKRIDAITPYRCGPVRSVVPCSIINHESSMDGYWLALNGGHRNPSSRVPCDERACGLYQLLGREKNAPWPVIVTWGRKLWRRYETLKRELRHHRIARGLSLSAWGY